MGLKRRQTGHAHQGHFILPIAHGHVALLAIDVAVGFHTRSLAVGFGSQRPLVVREHGRIARHLDGIYAGKTVGGGGEGKRWRGSRKWNNSKNGSVNSAVRELAPSSNLHQVPQTCPHLVTRLFTRCAASVLPSLNSVSSVKANKSCSLYVLPSSESASLLTSLSRR